jgi:hypothetical protein
MTNTERTERRTDAGAHPELGKARGQLEGRLPGALARELQNPLATALSIGAIGGPWFPPAGDQGWRVLLAAVVVVLIALLQFVGLRRARSTRRWKAALNAYAEREITRDRRGTVPPL